jgi:hypothetical protein
MKEVEQLYHNNFGVSFFWKKNNEVLKHRVQIVFKETGLYLSPAEIREFTNIIDETSNNLACAQCSNKDNCHKFLLKTPFRELDLAVCRNELIQIKDLMEGTLFNLTLGKYLENEGRN